MKTGFVTGPLLMVTQCLGQFILLPKYDDIKDFYDGLAAFEESGTWGFLNSKGEVIIKNTYTKVGDFSNGFAPVSVNGL